MEGLTEGRIVHYVLSETDVLGINEQRRRGDHVGNPVSIGEHVPMIIVKVFRNEFGEGKPGVNGKLQLDGTDTYWVTSREYEESGAAVLTHSTWHWIEKA